jgi:hypothetical protein
MGVMIAACKTSLSPPSDVTIQQLGVARAGMRVHQPSTTDTVGKVTLCTVINCREKCGDWCQHFKLIVSDGFIGGGDLHC